MRFIELLQKVQEQTNKEINQAEIGRIINCSRSQITYKKTNDVLVDDKDVQKIETFYNINLQNTCDNTVLLKYYPDAYATCGEGGFADTGTSTDLAVPVSFINGYNHNNVYSVINARSNSMSPIIMPSDLLIVKHSNIIEDEKIHIFTMDDKVFCKFLSLNLDEILIKSANNEYKNMSVKCDDITINGVVKGLIRKF